MKIIGFRKKALFMVVVVSLVAMTFMPLVNADVVSLNKSAVRKTGKQDVLSSLRLGDVKQVFEKYIDELRAAGVSTVEVEKRVTKTFNMLYEQGLTDDTTLNELVSLVRSGVLNLPTLLQLNILCKITSFCLVGMESSFSLFTTGMVWFGASLTKSYDSQVPIMPDQISVSMLSLIHI